MVQQASTILPGDDNTRLSNTYIHKEELGDQYKVVFSQFFTDFPYIKGPGGTVYVWGGGGVLIPLSYTAKMTLHCLHFLHAGTYILDFEAHQRNFPSLN